MIPIAVSHVCAYWRHISLRTPTLWRRICLDYRGDMWKERICRAKACTLEIQLSPWLLKSGRYYQQQLLDAHTVQWYMYLVIPFIHRWRSLEISFIESAPFLWKAALSECCSHSPRAQAHCLEELTLIYPKNDDPKEFCLFYGYAPRLQRLTLNGICLTWLPSLFQNLRYLDVAHHGFTTGANAVHDVISMLKVSNRLVELRISFPPKRIHPTRSMSWRAAIKRVSLPSLMTLRLTVESSDIPPEMAHLITLLSTPSLSHLDLMDTGRHRCPFPSLFSFLQHIPNSVRHLSLEHGWYSDVIMLPLLSRLPYLQQVVLKHLHVPHQVFHLSAEQ